MLYSFCLLNTGVMITITVSEDGTASVWNAEDWLTLREKHRIVGSLIGVLAHLPHQDVFKGLPLILLPEEATFLVESKIARLAVFPSLKAPPQEPVKDAFLAHRDKIFKEQEGLMQNERKRQLELVVDKIIEGRRNKLLGLGKKQKKGKKKQGDVKPFDKSSIKEEEDEVEETKPSSMVEESPAFDRDVVLQEELAKKPPLAKENALVQTFTAFPWLREEDACPPRWTFPKTRIEKLKYKVFKDLWGKGYYLTSGVKFGGDFLVYPGEPIKFHSHFIVVCVEYTATMNVLQFASYARMATAARKSLVFASLKSVTEELVYQTVSWAGMGPM